MKIKIILFLLSVSNLIQSSEQEKIGPFCHQLCTMISSIIKHRISDELTPLKKKLSIIIQRELIAIQHDPAAHEAMKHFEQHWKNVAAYHSIIKHLYEASKPERKWLHKTFAELQKNSKRKKKYLQQQQRLKKMINSTLKED
jgi:hypothetical protein